VAAPPVPDNVLTRSLPLYNRYVRPAVVLDRANVTVAPAQNAVADAVKSYIAEAIQSIAGILFVRVKSQYAVLRAVNVTSYTSATAGAVALNVVPVCVSGVKPGADHVYVTTGGTVGKAFTVNVAARPVDTGFGVTAKLMFPLIGIHLINPGAPVLSVNDSNV
jgi:hypothetical protein